MVKIDDFVDGSWIVGQAHQCELFITHGRRRLDGQIVCSAVAKEVPQVGKQQKLIIVTDQDRQIGPEFLICRILIADGHRRWRACRVKGHQKVLAIIKSNGAHFSFTASRGGIHYPGPSRFPTGIGQDLFVEHDQAELNAAENQQHQQGENNRKLDGRGSPLLSFWGRFVHDNTQYLQQQTITDFPN